MPLPLREPFFLQGRTSVVQRAVIMSAVLGGLACIAGWGFAIATVVTNAEWRWLAALVSGPTAVIICVDAPLNYWNCQSPFRTREILPVVGLVLLILGDLAVNGPGGDRAMGWIALSILGMNLRHIRGSHEHVNAFAISTLGAIVCAGCSAVIFSRGPALFFGMGTISLALSLAATAVGILVPMSIPWGIPFWWPPRVPEAP